VNCARTGRLLDAWLDDELDARTRDEMAEHIAGCAECAARRAERTSLLHTLRTAPVRHTAPHAFAAALRRELEHADTSRLGPRGRPTWWAATAIAAVAASAGAAAMFAWLYTAGLDGPQHQAVASHVAALAAAHGRTDRLVQIEATDRHVVRPWFQGKVDFSPPVRDLAADGFVLVGARLDRIDARPAAVVVYRTRNHPVELFVWRANGAPAPAQFFTDRGYGVVLWAEQGLRFAAVSDVDAGDLERFARLLQSDSGSAPVR
jgi:anti-sigma factor RsiW